MPRVAPPDRFEKLIAAATAAFVRDGFHHTQMDDIAGALSVSKGTVYRYVDSKETLFGAVLEYADRPGTTPIELPLCSLDLTNIADDVRSRLDEAFSGLHLAATVADPAPVSDAGVEAESLTLELFEASAAHRAAIMVLDRCAAELGEVAGEWYGRGRYALVELWAEYLWLRAGDLALPCAIEFLARTIVETISLWAVKMPWDPAPRPYDASTAGPACAAVVRAMLTGGG